ncbi:MAG: 23S rRNA (adenine(2503)-C(2))-methyltransferase RlmN [Dehalococcoidia bacterium]
MSRPIWGLLPEEIETLMAEWGEPAYRARQVLRWAYKEGATTFEQMTNLPAGLRAKLGEEIDLSLPTVVRWQSADDNLTRKALLQLGDGETVEAVLMQYAARPKSRARATVCVSTQVGCAMGCVFCATGQAGFVRNLATADIVAQVVHFIRSEGRVTNIVFMGMGEPLANYSAMWKAVQIINHPQCIGLGARNITISTVGLVPGIRRLAREPLQVNLAISLHAPTDGLRRQLIPTAGQPISELIEAAKEFFAASGRRITFEYVLIDHVNDSPEQAALLADLVAGVPCHVNLIPVNPTPDSNIKRPARSRTLAFQRVLQERGVPCTVRVEKGVEIESACGQLRGIREGAGRHGHRRGELPLPVLAG